MVISPATNLPSPLLLSSDAPNGDLSGKITFPVPSDKANVLERLVKDCQPATFGYGGENVLDESIRKAGKLEASEFSTSFNPYDYGIVDAISQALLPGIARPKLEGGNTNEENWGVVAEIYKLNVYSAPSDKFKPHVDTPRGYTQFGSLVVCGKLRVAHKGVEQFFDLGDKPDDNSTIHWAAFYSDCEHEVLPVKSGHRITLTYQLYVSEHLGGVIHPQFPTADPKLYPLYHSIKTLLSSPAFMKNGGILGFHCAHQYAHTDGTANERLPHALKGMDVVFFTIFRFLGLKVHVRPILNKEFREDDLNSDDENFVDPSRITRAAPEFRDIIIVADETYGEREDSQVSQTVNRLRESLNLGDGLSSDIAEQISEYWGGYEMFKDVVWVNDKVGGEGEVALAFQQWVGNETETGWWYSLVAILVEVPVFSERILEHN